MLLNFANPKILKQQFVHIKHNEVSENRLIVAKMAGNTIECNDSCSQKALSSSVSFKNYFFHEGDNLLEAKQYSPMLVDITAYKDFSVFEQFVKTFAKGDRIKLKKQSIRDGFYCKPFVWKKFIPDIFDIKHSKDELPQDKNSDLYLQEIDTMGGSPKVDVALNYPKCSYHWQMSWGVFQPIEGYMQGEVRTNEKLLGYVSLQRYGEIAAYSQFLGHHDYLGKGIMVHLHHAIIEWVFKNETPFSKNLKYIMYGAYENGNGSMLEWKKNGGFIANTVVANIYSSPEASKTDSLQHILKRDF